MALDLARMTEMGDRHTRVYLTYPCVSVSLRQAGGVSPSPAQTPTGLSPSADFTWRQTSAAKGAFSIAGVCKDEQAERGGKRRHMTKGKAGHDRREDSFIK